MKPPRLLPEAQLLLLAAGGPNTDSEIDELVRTDLNWPLVIALARRENALRVLWHRFSGANEAFIPEESLSFLKRAGQVWEFRMLHLEGLLHRTLEVWREHGIEAVLMKGSALAYTTYKSFDDRSMYDLDLLVEPEAAQEAWNLAQENGWVWDSKFYPLRQYEGHHHLPPLIDVTGTDVRLEVHVDLCRTGYPFDFSARNVWSGARKILVDGRDVLVPKVTDQIIHTCVHFAWSHALRSKAFATLRDICAYVEREQIDWDDLIRESKATQTDTCCYWTFRVARSVSRAAVPLNRVNELRRRLPESALVRIERHIEAHILPSESQSPSTLMNQWVWRLAIGCGPGDGEAMEILGVSEEATVAPADRQKTSAWQRTINQLQSLDRWRRYLRSTL
jgi:hypothetical protein